MTTSWLKAIQIFRQNSSDGENLLDMPNAQMYIQVYQTRG